MTVAGFKPATSHYASDALDHSAIVYAHLKRRLNPLGRSPILLKVSVGLPGQEDRVEQAVQMV